jgi:hypothetical protein
MFQHHSIARRLAATVAILTISVATPAIAGEITGNGTDIDINGRSICVYSGHNDTPGGDPENGDPGGHAQSFGYFGGYWDMWDAQELDPHEDFLSPGFACNPNRGPDLNVGG